MIGGPEGDVYSEADLAAFICEVGVIATCVGHVGWMGFRNLLVRPSAELRVSPPLMLFPSVYVSHRVRSFVSLRKCTVYPHTSTKVKVRLGYSTGARTITI